MFEFCTGVTIYQNTFCFHVVLDTPERVCMIQRCFHKAVRVLLVFTRPTNHFSSLINILAHTLNQVDLKYII